MTTRKFLFVLVFLTVFLVFNYAEASSIVLEPEYPKANTSFEAKILLGIDDYATEIVWFVNEEPVASTNQKISLTAPKNNNEMTIKALVKYKDKEPEIIVRKIKPVNMDILYEASTYTLPFWGVSSISTPGSEISLHAVVDIDGYEANKLVYVWKKDGVKIQYKSGVGKKDIKITGSYFANGHAITLLVRDPDTLDLLATKTIYIPFLKPEIRIYGKDDLLGWMFNQPIKEGKIIKGKTSLLALPYGFSIKNMFDDNIVWSWFVGNTQIDKEKANIPLVDVSFKNKDIDKAQLSVKAEYKNNILQSARSEIMIYKFMSQNIIS